ncbi:MAG: hypothetical protein SNG27_07670 [Rikenellaceae bacterium]
MDRLQYSNVVFEPTNHVYTTQDGVILSGITSMLSRQLFADKYNDIPQYILDKAAERGHYMHEQLQQVVEIGFADDIPEIKNFLALKERYNIKPVACEYLVTDNTHFATQVDLVAEGEAMDVFDLCDYKRTAKLDEEYLSWQLSVNAYLFEMQNPTLRVGKLYAFWLRGEDISERREVERKDDSLVAQLLFCDSNDMQFEYSKPVVQERAEIQQLINAENLIITIETQLKSAKANREKMLEAIKASIEENGGKSYESDRVKITLTKPSQRVSLDATALKTEMPEIYEKYTKVSEVKSSIRLTLKKAK